MWYNPDMRNDIVLCWEYDGSILESHFKLREFESRSGLVVVDSKLVRLLELVRRDLCVIYRQDVQIIITSGTRTEAENEELGERLGWCEDGGSVARDSRHLPKYGGIAVDCYARIRSGVGWEIVPQSTLGSACRVYYAHVKDDYADGHVHADCRHQTEV
jgi:hypothetical protein